MNAATRVLKGQYYDVPSDNSDSEYPIQGEAVFPVQYFKGSRGQAIGLWSYLRHDNIAIFTPGRDLVYRVVTYAQKHLGYDRNLHKMTVLTPGTLTPLDIKRVYNIRPGSVVMVTPDSKIHVTIEIDQLKDRISIEVDLITAVHTIKRRLRKLKGFPVDRQDLLFKEKALENNRRLLEYRVRNNSVLYLLIQTHFDLLVNVSTFWGKSYRFYMDPCSTGKDVIFAVLNRTLSKNGHKDERIYEYYIPLHVLVLIIKGKIISWDICFASMKFKSGDHIILTTVGYLNEIEMQHFQVVMETGQRYQVITSQYDRWSVVAFLLHGQADVPVDLMMIYKNGDCMELQSVIGPIPSRTSIIMNVVMKYVDNDLMFGIPLRIDIGNGITEQITISLSKTVLSVKKKLERLGVPNATLYELTMDSSKVSNSMRVQDIFSVKLPLKLKLAKFPVFAHNFNGMIFKTLSPVTQTIGQFRHKMELKSGQRMSKCRLVLCGRELREHDTTKLHEAGLSIGTSIFIGPEYEAEHFLVLDGGKMMKLRIPVNPRLVDIRNAVLDESNVPPHCVNCLLTFLYWYFFPRFSSNYRTEPAARKRNQLPMSDGTLLHFQPLRLGDHFSDGVIKAHEKFPYHIKTGSNRSWPDAGHRKSDPKWPKFEQSQILDNT